jgi:hypothetical protein
MSNPPSRYILRRLALSTGDDPGYYTSPNPSTGTTPSAAQAVRYATRELAEAMAAWMPGPCEVVEAPPTREDLFRALLAEQDGPGSSPKALEDFNRLYPPNDGLVTDLPAEVLNPKWGVTVGRKQVELGNSELTALRAFAYYAARGEGVTLIRNGRVTAEHDPCDD